MNEIINLLLLLSIGINVVLLILVITLQQSKNKLKNYMDKPNLEIQNKILKKKLILLSQDPDSLSELVRYATLVRQGHKELIPKGPEVIDFFLSELENRWHLTQIGPFKSVSRYNPNEHRCEAPVKPGDSVEIIRPGWRLNGEVIKHATVKRV